MQMTLKESKFIYSIPKIPVYLHQTLNNKYFMNITKRRGIKNRDFFSLLGVQPGVIEITKEEFSTYIESYNAYCIYIDKSVHMEDIIL